MKAADQPSSSFRDALARMPSGLLSAAALSTLPYFQAAAAAAQEREREKTRAELDQRNAAWFADHASIAANLARRFRPRTIMGRKMHRYFRFFQSRHAR